MERLTDKSWRNLDPWECCGQDKYCKRGCHEQGGCTNGCIVPKLYTRLAEYEDMAERKPKTNADRIRAMTDDELDYDAVKKAFDEEFKSTRKLIESGETHLDNLAEGFTEADRVLRKMLTVDAVKVIRCRNCIHDSLSTCPMCYIEGKTLVFVNHDPDFYCGNGERRCEE